MWSLYDTWAVSMYFWSVSFGVPNFFWSTKKMRNWPDNWVPSMWFWSVSWSTNCLVFFSFFLVDQKKLSRLREFLVSLWEFLVHQKEIWSTKKNFGTPKRNLVDQKFPETDQKFPETGQFFFGRPKKMRKRPDNWSTKRLTKTTWTGLWSTKETDQKYMDAASSYGFTVLIYIFSFMYNNEKKWIEEGVNILYLLIVRNIETLWMSLSYLSWTHIMSVCTPNEWKMKRK